nr:immunoglobulin heavy chain junction region [Mus musculus]
RRILQSITVQEIITTVV